MNVLNLNSESVVIGIKNVLDDYELKVDELVIDSYDISLIGKSYVNGEFVSVAIEDVVPEPSIEEQILYETQYQTMLIETSTSF